MSSSNKNMKESIKKEQEKLKKYTDERLRQIHLGLYDSAIKDGEEIDAILLTAIKNEVQRRWQTVSWIWKRKTHAEEYEAWNTHHTQMEIKASEFLIYTLSKHGDPQSQDTIKTLQNYIKSLK